MSLWRYKRTIAKAIDGDLSGAQESQLRTHLRSCVACRAHYDALSAVVAFGNKALAPDRERNRLAHLLDLPVPPKRMAATRRRWVWAFPVLVPALAFLLWARLGPGPTGESPTWRGGGEAEPETWPLSLLLYGFAKDSPPDLAAPVVLGELPFSKGITVNKDTLVQFGYKRLQQTPQPLHLAIVAEQNGKRVTLFPRRAQDNAALVPGEAVKPLGASLDLGAAFVPGKVRLWVVLSPKPLSQDELDTALGRDTSPSRTSNLDVFHESLTLVP